MIIIKKKTVVASIIIKAINKIITTIMIMAMLVTV